MLLSVVNLTLLHPKGVQTSDGETQTGANQPQSGDITTPDAGQHSQRGKSFN